MTTQSTLWVPSATSDTVLRAAAQAYSDMLTAVGVLKTADTGQVVISTLTLPAVVSANPPTYLGYEIRKLTAPGMADLFLKFEYGIIASTANTPSTYRFTVRVEGGRASNGAGVLDGQKFVNYVSQYSSTTGPNTQVSTTLARPLHMASDGANYLTIINDPSGLANTSIKYGYLNVALERSINAITGAYDGEAWVSFNPYVNMPNGAFQCMNNISGTSKSSPSSSAPVGYQIPPGDWVGSNSLTTATIMPCTVTVPTPKGPARATLLAYTPDVNYGGQYQINMYGALVTYMAANDIYSSAMVNGYTSANYTPLLRFD